MTNLQIAAFAILMFVTGLTVGMGPDRMPRWWPALAAAILWVMSVITAQAQDRPLIVPGEMSIHGLPGILSEGTAGYPLPLASAQCGAILGCGAASSHRVTIATDQPDDRKLSWAYRECEKRRATSTITFIPPNPSEYFGDIKEACEKIRTHWQESAAAREQREAEVREQQTRAQLREIAEKLK